MRAIDLRVVDVDSEVEIQDIREVHEYAHVTCTGVRQRWKWDVVDGLFAVCCTNQVSYDLPQDDSFITQKTVDMNKSNCYLTLLRICF